MRKFLLFAGLAVLVVNRAQAHMGATGIVLERMEAMKEIASAVENEPYIPSFAQDHFLLKTIGFP